MLLRELGRTLIAFAFLVTVASVMAWIQLMNDNVSLKRQITMQPSLADFANRLHGAWWVRPWMADVSLYFMVGGGVAGLVFGYALRGRLLYAVQTLRRFLWLMGLGYALRGLTLAGTILPPSNPSCNYVHRTAWEAMQAVPQLLSGSTHTCSDKIFSGHTLVATLLAAFWFHYSGNWRLCKVYAGLNWLLMVTCSLAGRHHYTVDIVVGAIVAALIFNIYRLLLRLVTAEQASCGQCIGNGHVQVNRILRAIIVFMDGLDIRDPGMGKTTGVYLPIYLDTATSKKLETCV